MPSQLHESHLLLFRNQPAEYRADMVVQLFDETSVFGIVVEVQLSADDRKRYVWPAYVANLRARLECPVALLVVAADDAVARWAAKCVEMGGLHQFAPYVLGPSGVPEIADEVEARANPELAVLSAMAHGMDHDIERAKRIALAAQSATAALDSDRSKLYFDLILSSLSEAARRALNAVDIRKYEYQSDFARRYLAQGVAQGEAAGRLAIIAELLTAKFGPLSAEAEGKFRDASINDLHAMAGRLLMARSLPEVLGTT